MSDTTKPWARAGLTIHQRSVLALERIVKGAGGMREADVIAEAILAAVAQALADAAPRWISVKERMPEPEGKYKYPDVLIHYDGVTAVGNCFDGLWKDDNGDEQTVSFWQPLPAPPQEEEK